MPHSYATALSHLVLAGTGIYCLTKVGYKELSFPTVAYGIVTTNSILGIWKYGNPDHGDKVDKPFKITSFIQTLFALPCITCTIWLNYSYMKELAYAHVGLPLIPFAAFLADKEKQEVTQAVVAITTISLGVVSAMEKNYFGLAAAVSFLADYFIVQEESDILNIPSEDFFNYIMCFVSYFALRALND